MCLLSQMDFASGVRFVSEVLGEFVCTIIDHGRASSWGEDARSYSMRRVGERIVRCKHCKYSEDCGERRVICSLHGFGATFDDFCSWGEI